jgi:hypothetical protein
MEEKNGLVIGPSDGWLFAQEIYDLAKHKKFLQEAGANATELVMDMSKERRQKSLTNGDQMDFPFVSIHLDDYYPDGSLFQQVKTAKDIFDKHKATYGVLHPVGVPSFYIESLTAIGIPVAIENMDKNKPCGYTRYELWRLIEKFHLKFVLDLQHAYEHDSGMAYAWDLFQMAGPELVYLHVSGQSEKTIHSLVHLADNKDSIVKLLGKIFSKKKLPIILEGQYITAQEVKKEIEFLKKELGF